MGVTSDIKGFSYFCYGIGEYGGPAAANGDLEGIYLKGGGATVKNTGISAAGARAGATVRNPKAAVAGEGATVRNKTAAAGAAARAGAGATIA
jgi:hypothetical protein